MCIVDEAGQMTLPVALGPILHSKYVLLQPVIVDAQTSTHVPCIIVTERKPGSIQEHQSAY